MTCIHRHLTWGTAALIAAALVGGPALADPITVTGDPNHRRVTSDTPVGTDTLLASRNSRRLGEAPTADGSGVTGLDFAIRKMTGEGYSGISVLGPERNRYAAFDQQGREMVIRFDPYRNAITEVTPRSDIRARRMAGN